VSKHVTTHPRKGAPTSISRLFSAGLVPLYALPEDYTSCQDVVGILGLHEEQEGMHFNRILEACEFHGISHLLQFSYNWNQEIITDFYSTLFFDK
jgi:hypothetical protein